MKAATVTLAKVMDFELRNYRERALESAQRSIRALQEFERRMLATNADDLATIGQVPTCSTESLRGFLVDLGTMHGYALAVETASRDLRERT